MSHRPNDCYFTGLDKYPASYKPSWKPIDEVFSWRRLNSSNCQYPASYKPSWKPIDEVFSWRRLNSSHCKYPASYKPSWNPLNEDQ
ncbi:hypothetical protein DPMN_055419 [Dreissena polymorpha]|uniref:Uncharacterized protein n=1 Tax=Dreissena polymorpha TaxID=45954 RepID=A0A9D4HU25_DREPO|nr:hypothetical protein DPMN_055419 [Dreissena polymorpha]